MLNSILKAYKKGVISNKFLVKSTEFVQLQSVDTMQSILVLNVNWWGSTFGSQTSYGFILQADGQSCKSGRYKE